MKTPLSLKGPKLSAADKEALSEHKASLESAIAQVEQDFQKVTELEEKKAKLKKQAPALQRAAAAIDPDAEQKLEANQKAIQRADQAIQEAEAQAYDWKGPLFTRIDQAQELISRICQATYEALLDQIGNATAAYYRSSHDARFYAKQLPAVSDLVVTLLTHHTNAYDSIERLVESAKATLRKINALLNGEEVWSYSGGEAD